MEAMLLASSPATSDANDAPARVLVTGASGKIGKHVLTALAGRGYRVRAVTTKPLSAVSCADDKVEWVRFDWLQSADFGALVDGCAAVLHLGAELRDHEKMHQSNVEATRLLARASEAASVRFFCYASSVAVYGSQFEADVDENSPVLTADRDVSSEYLAVDTVRCYGRTKLGGEQRIREEARDVEYVIVRPTVVVDVDDLVDLRSWDFIKKAVAGYRNSQQIFILDVADAMVWFMERSLARATPQPGISVFNLADNTVPDNTYANFFRRAYDKSADARWRSIELPWVFDGLRDILRAGRLSRRRPLGRMRFSTDRLLAAGYRHRYGIAELQERAIQALTRENDV
jgi:nucleoside-diphosphate-sugar epimerase